MKSERRAAAALLTRVGVGLVIVGIMLYVGAGIASAIEYNMAETIEGTHTGPPPIWIQALAWSAIALGAAGVVLTLLGIISSALRRRRSRAVAA